MRVRQLYRALVNKRKALIAQRMEYYNVNENEALNLLNYQYDRRIPWAIITLPVEGVDHKFEIRGFKLEARKTGVVLVCRAVNWTLGAGACSLEINKKICGCIRLYPY